MFFFYVFFSLTLVLQFITVSFWFSFLFFISLTVLVLINNKNIASSIFSFFSYFFSFFLFVLIRFYVHIGSYYTLLCQINQIWLVWMNEWGIYIALYCVLLYTQALYNHMRGSLFNHHLFKWSSGWLTFS